MSMDPYWISIQEYLNTVELKLIVTFFGSFHLLDWFSIYILSKNAFCEYETHFHPECFKGTQNYWCQLKLCKVFNCQNIIFYNISSTKWPSTKTDEIFEALSICLYGMPKVQKHIWVSRFITNQISHQRELIACSLVSNFHFKLKIANELYSVHFTSVLIIILYHYKTHIECHTDQIILMYICLNPTQISNSINCS